nr:MAG TPA: hypothetical protein [Caudoviricetes sp.]
MSEEKQTYEVTALAGPRVAGKRVAVNDKLLLTEAEARTEVLAGVIIEVVELPVKAPSKKD